MGKFEGATITDGESLVTSESRSSLINVTHIVPLAKGNLLNQLQICLLCQLHYFPVIKRINILVCHVNLSILGYHFSCTLQKPRYHLLVKPESNIDTSKRVIINILFSFSFLLYENLLNLAHFMLMIIKSSMWEIEDNSIKKFGFEQRVFAHSMSIHFMHNGATKVFQFLQIC